MAKSPGSETMILCEQGECPGVPALPGLRASDLLPVPLLLRVHREAPRHGATTTIHEGVVYRWARKMDDKDIAPNTVHTAGPVGMGRKSRQYTIHSSIVPIQAGLSARRVGTHWISCMYLVQYPRLLFCRPHLS